jgi:hypothetical protein
MCMSRVCGLGRPPGNQLFQETLWHSYDFSARTLDVTKALCKLFESL